MNKAGDKLPVALRKESVDRNVTRLHSIASRLAGVALRKESVDRNMGFGGLGGSIHRRRSPQGERG